MPLPSSLDQFAPLGRVANEMSRPLVDVIEMAFDGLTADASRVFNARRDSLGRVVDVAMHGRAADLLGPVETPPPLPVTENVGVDLVGFADAIASPALATYGQKWEPTIQSLASLSGQSLRRAVYAMANNMFDAVEESVSDAMNALSLGSTQVATSVQEALSEFAALETPRGGYAPPLGGLMLDHSLRGRAADERWDAWGVPLHYMKLGTAGRFYLLPAVDQGVVVHSVVPGANFSAHPTADATMRWHVEMSAAGHEAPTIRSGYVVRGALS